MIWKVAMQLSRMMAPRCAPFAAEMKQTESVARPPKIKNPAASKRPKLGLVKRDINAPRANANVEKRPNPLIDRKSMLWTP